jgi:putative heme transporter
MPAPLETEPSPSKAERVPGWLLRWGAISWRLIAVAIVVYGSFRVLRSVSVVVTAVLISLFLASVLWIPVRWLIDRGNWPPMLATITAMIVAFAVLAGLVAFIVPSVAGSFEDISSDVGSAWESTREWLVEGPLGLSETQIDDSITTVGDRIMEGVRGSAVGGATAVAEFFAGLFLVVMVTFFVLKDGRVLAHKLFERLPDDKSSKVETSLRIGWKTLSRYMAGIAAVGLVDATAIAIGLWVVGVPLVFPLAILVFFGAFFPLIGAFVSGLLAVAVAFVNGGLTDALIVLGIVVLVQQLEGDVVLPLVFGKALELHPLLILLAVAAGGIAFGLLGAFLAVPLIAVVVSIREALADDGEETYMSLARG